MNIKSVSVSNGMQGVAHQSAYLYGVDRDFLPPKPKPELEYVTLDGPGKLETLYQYRQIEGWLGDVPVSLTYLMAYRSYEYTKNVFTKTDWNTQNSNTNSWLV